MFLVGGGILVHGIPAWHDRLRHVVAAAHEVRAIGGLLGALLPALGAVLVGVVAGTLVLLVVSAVRRVVGKSAHG